MDPPQCATEKPRACLREHIYNEGLLPTSHPPSVQHYMVSMEHEDGNVLTSYQIPNGAQDHWLSQVSHDFY
jgi:hypothetical protein